MEETPEEIWLKAAQNPPDTPHYQKLVMLAKLENRGRRRAMHEVAHSDNGSRGIVYASSSDLCVFDGYRTP